MSYSRFTICRNLFVKSISLENLNLSVYKNADIAECEITGAISEVIADLICI